MVTEQDVLGALMALDGLPRRNTSLADVHLQGFVMAMEGRERGVIVVAACDLAAAVRNIMQGALRHGFHPSPSELRMWCNAALEERGEEVRRARRRKEMEDNAAWHRPFRTAEEIERHHVLMQKFNESRPKKHVDFTPKLDPVLVAAIPDRPPSEVYGSFQAVNRMRGGVALSSSSLTGLAEPKVEPLKSADMRAAHSSDEAAK